MSSSLSRKFPRLVSEAPNEDMEEEPGSEVSPAAPEPSPYLAGEVIGDRYRLVRELGRGGMGVVWVGYALALGVEVAVKLIHANVAGSVISSRMAREAHAAARLGHPALVRVFDFGWTSRGDPYLVMELVQGETLSAMLDREERISAIRAVQMLLPIADGLRLAHDRSIVHRDIKPDNIFMATDPLGRVQPKLLDFGIAKVGPANVDGRLTQMGVVLGSPEYMSPEQALGAEDVDERTDVWSLSVVLYEMVTGNVPHRKANYNALMQAIIHDEVQPMTDYEGGDPSLWQVVSVGLMKDRDQRWHTMAELGEALALWLYEHGIKEDICGNSIRAVWLDGAMAKLPQIDTAPPSAGLSLRALRYSPTARTQVRQAPRRGIRGARSRVSILIAALGLVGLSALGLQQWGAKETSAAKRPEASASSAPAAQRPPRVSATPDETATSAQRSYAAEELPEEPARTKPAPTNARAVAGSQRSRAGAPAARPSDKQARKRRDFGF